MTENPAERLSSVYLTFAEREAHNRSPLYEELARAVAGDPSTLAFLAELPPPKQQPNLLFAAVRYLYGTPTGWEHFRRLLSDHRNEVAALMMTHSTQTNEPARCATLLPLLAKLPQPLALLEVGAAAGLCLLPDRYAYDYDGHHVPPTSVVAEDTPTFSCRTNRATPAPIDGIKVVWRAGLDLNPIDVNDHAQIAWLETLVWPGEGNRLDLLRSALKIARQDPPEVFQGDLRTDVPALVAQAPKNTTLVVFHTSVLCYVTSSEERAAFVQTMRDLRVVWISNESPGLFPQITENLSEPWPPSHLLLSLDEQPIAWTDSHGTHLSWIVPSS